MSVNINADTTNGLVLTSDTSGEIKLQSAGADIATVSSTGITMASGKTLPASALTGSLPAGMGGKILQVKNAQHSSTTQLTSSGAFHELSTSFRISITPQSATSTLYLSFFAPYVSPNSGNLAFAYFYDVTNSSAVNLPTAGGSRQACTWSKRTQPYDPNDNDTINMMTAVASSNTTARTYTIYHRTEGAVHQFLQSSLSTGSGTNTKPIFTIMEVEA
jgi:hypothetical protein